MSRQSSLAAASRTSSSAAPGRLMRMFSSTVPLNRKFCCGHQPHLPVERPAGDRPDLAAVDEHLPSVGR